MNNLLKKAVLVVALAFGLGAVSPTYAGILDITDPANPVERFFDIHLVHRSNRALFELTVHNNLTIDIDASQPGVLVASARGNTFLRLTGNSTGTEFSLHDALSATLMTFPDSTISRIIVVFAGGKLIFKRFEGPVSNFDLVGGNVAIRFDESTGEVFDIFISYFEPNGATHQIRGRLSGLTGGSTFREL